MFSNYRIVTFSPAGRERNMKLLHRYLMSFRNLVDSHEWWVNTPNESDQRAIKEITALAPDFYRAVEVEMPYADFGHRVILERLREFYRQRCCDTSTIYIKLDDDFCYIGRDAFTDLLQFRVEHPEYFLVCPPTVNSVFQTHILQRTAQLPREPYLYGYGAFDANGFASGEAVQQLHENFLASLQGTLGSSWQFPKWELNEWERATIGATCFFGSDFAAFGGDVTNDDEHYLMSVKPRELERVNAFAPCRAGRDAFFAHYAYSAQKAHLDATDILSRYENAATWRRL